MISRMTIATATLAAIVALSLTIGAELALAQEAADGGADFWGPTLRMILGLAGVLAVLGAFAYLAQRLKQGTAFKTGSIEIVSGLSLGGREKVVLLRVGGDEILVGISPGGIRTLHVMQGVEPANFEAYVEATQTMRKIK